MPTPAALTFTHLNKRYGTRAVLHDVHFTIAQGEACALVGENGAGKTSLIKTLLDFSPADAGHIDICGHPHTDPRARQTLAYLPERFVPPAHLSGHHFLAYMERLHHVARTPTDTALAVSATLTALDFATEALDRPVRDYSKGMAQKLGLAAILLSNKPLLILDEPMSGLDPKARILLKRHLTQLKAQGITLFFTTHALADVEELADRMAIMHRGRLSFVGSPSQCCATYGAPHLEAAYLHAIADEAPLAA